jgi:tripartite-type tricarboxylate transporter receptor subunit TctC
MKPVVCLLLIAAGAAFAAHAPAQSYPTKPIRMVAPSGAGGPVDVICRTISKRLGQVLKQQIIIENRVGAAGLIGTEYVSKQPADGYTLLFGFSGPLAIVPNFNPNTPYDPLRDLAPISQVAAAPYVLLVHPSVPAKSVKELVALAKGRPGQMNFASGGNGVGLHMAGELFKIAAGVDIVHVPYKGAAPAMTALMAGEVDMMFNGLPAALPHIQSGRVRALAVGGEKATPLLPGLPTVQSAGYNFNTEGWYGVVAPSGTPPAVINTIHRGLVEALGSREIQTAFQRLAVEGVGSSPAEFRSKIAEELQKWAEVIKQAGIRMK